MILSTIKSIAVFIINTIDEKLQTKTGRLTLLIVGGIIVGGAVVHSYNMQKNYDSLQKEKLKIELDKVQLQLDINNIIKNSDKECNEKVKQAALFQQELQYIYTHKVEENNRFLQEQSKIVKEKEKLLSTQAPIINKLKSLNK